MSEARFTHLAARLTLVSANRSRRARVRAERKEGSTKGASIPKPSQGGIKRPQATTPSNTTPQAAAPAPPKAADPSQLKSWPVPEHVQAKGSAAVEGYRLVYSSVTDQLARMSKIDAANGRIASLIDMVASGASDAEIRARLPEARTDRDRQISAMWNRAIAAVFRNEQAARETVTSTGAPAPRDDARRRMVAVASDPLFLGNEVAALKLLTMHSCQGVSAAGMIDALAMMTGTDRSAAALWDQAIASVFGANQTSRGDDQYRRSAIQSLRSQ